MPHNHMQYDNNNMPHNNMTYLTLWTFILQSEHMLIWMTDTVMKTSKLTSVCVCVCLWKWWFRKIHLLSDREVSLVEKQADSYMFTQNETIEDDIKFDIHNILYGNCSWVGLIVFCDTQNLCDNLFLKDDIITYTIPSAKGQLDETRRRLHFHNRMARKGWKLFCHCGLNVFIIIN